VSGTGFSACLAFALATAPGISFGQVAAESRPTFEVASIKLNKANTPVDMGVGNGQGGGHNVTLKALLAFAYRLPDFQISGGPGWAGSERFDVEGKAQDRAADPDRLRRMLQSLLEDRFQLKLHRETKAAPAYALLIAKGGPKIKRSQDQTSPAVNGPAPPGAGPNHGAMRLGASSLIGNAVMLSLFTRLLSQRLDRPVIDRTNLTGRFDLQLQWSPEVGEPLYGPGGNPLPPGDPSGPSIFTAIQEQLGLKLESIHMPVEFLVIGHAEMPSAN